MSNPIALPIVWLRSLSEAFLPDTADVLRYTATNTPDGVAQGWAVVQAGVACRVSTRVRSPRELLAAGAQAVASSEWIIWLPALTDTTPQDRVVVHGSDRADGRTFEVTTVVEVSYEAVRRVVCELVE
jgi:hypothetical protein